VEVKFKQWLIKKGNEDKVSLYPNIIHLISEHYSEQVGYPVDIFEMQDTKKLASLYGIKGKFSNFGAKESGAFRIAISSYCKFHCNLRARVQNESLMEAVEAFCIGESNEPSYDFDNLQVMEAPNTKLIKTKTASMNFEYEIDLQSTICTQIPELFPEYIIFGGVSIGVEYEVGSRKIDILLENMSDKSLLVIELKSGKADFKVFGQISMYISLIRREFPDRNVTGIIIAGEIDDSLIQASEINDLVTTMTYSIGVQLKKT